MDVLRRVLEAAPPATSSLDAWWEATIDERSRWGTPIDRAVLGGALADRVAFAFAGGYHEALQQLVPGLAGARASLCATEQGGNHPRAIATRLTRVAADGFELTGTKTWATAAGDAARLLVVATTGERDGRPQLVVACVRAAERGVTLTPSSAPFVPELPHARVVLERVAVSEADLLPGDGYEDYLKPFRTIEDLHVHGALLGYLLGVTRRRRLAGAPAIGAAIAATRQLAAQDPRAASTHVALAGLLDDTARIVGELEPRWQAVADDEHARWLRDRALLAVAASARAARLERAKQQLGLA